MTKEQLELMSQDATAKQRLADYAHAAAERRRELADKVKEWHPLAAAEKSERFEALRRDTDWIKREAHEPDEYWHNGTYDVTVRRHWKDPVFESKGGMIQIGISSADGTARHDWRDMQAIKNQIAGPECEGFELFPAESRLIDPSNYYILWCFPSLRKLKLGMDEGRRVWDTDMAMAPQRALPK